MLILGFWGGLGELAAGMVCTSPSGEVVCSGSSGGGGGISILIYGCSFVVMLALLCSDSGKVIITSSNEGKDHGLIPAAKVEVGLELALEAGPRLALEAGLETVLEPTVKVTLMVTYGACIPDPLMNLHPGGE